MLYKGGEYFNENLQYLTGLDSFYTLALISLESDREFVLTNRFEREIVPDETDIADIRTCTEEDLIERLIDLFTLHRITLLHCDYALESRTPLPAEILDVLRSVFPALVIKGLPRELVDMRLVKEPAERVRMHEGIAVVERLFARLPECITQGVPEAEIAALIHEELVRNHFNRFYDIMVASGPNSAIPLYRKYDSILPPNHVVLIDICAAYKDYVIDMTRTLPTSGHFPEQMVHYHALVKEVHQQAIDSVKPGSTLRELSDKAQGTFQEHGLGRFYYNKIGHFLGLSPDDPGSQDTPLEKHMVITIEPGLYFPEERFGLRMEDTILITE